MIHWGQSIVGFRLDVIENKFTLPPGRALLTLLNPATEETAHLAEAALAQDWLKPEEDLAWEHLQPGK